MARKHAALSLVVALFVACHAAPAPPAGPLVARYLPEAHTVDRRRAAVLAARPVIDSIFRTHAVARHHVGQVWGVVVDDELVFVDSYGQAALEPTRPVDLHTRFHIASLTKSFVSLAILRLRDAGALSLDDPIATHVPELARHAPLAADAPAVTLEHLMTMTSGLPEDNPWADRRLEDSDEAWEAFLARGLSFSTVPGGGYEYSNLGYALLGEVITRVSGRPYQRFITEELLEPLGMFETHWDYADVPPDELALGYRFEDDSWKLEPMLHTGPWGAIGGLVTSLHDLARYAGFHLSAWPPRDDDEGGANARPARRSTLRAMHTPHMPRLDPTARSADGALCATMTGYGYGFGVRVDCHGERRVAHTGGLPGFGANLQLFPDAGIAVLSLANLTYASSSAPHNEAAQVLRTAGVLKPRTLPVPPALAARAREVATLVRTWDEALGRAILADNVYLDRSRERRRREAAAIFAASGEVREIEEVVPENQLRGSFIIRCAACDVRVTFTQSPELPPRVQYVALELM